MAKATYYLGLFLGGCVATSLLGVVATLHPVFFRLAVLVAILIGMIWLLGWLLDDWLIEQFRIERMNYYGALILLAVAVVLGGGVCLWIIL